MRLRRVWLFGGGPTSLIYSSPWVPQCRCNRRSGLKESKRGVKELPTQTVPLPILVSFPDGLIVTTNWFLMSHRILGSHVDDLSFPWSGTPQIFSPQFITPQNDSR